MHHLHHSPHHLPRRALHRLRFNRDEGANPQIPPHRRRAHERRQRRGSGERVAPGDGGRRVLGEERQLRAVQVRRRGGGVLLPGEQGRRGDCAGIESELAIDAEIHSRIRSEFGEWAEQSAAVERSERRSDSDYELGEDEGDGGSPLLPEEEQIRRFEMLHGNRDAAAAAADC